MKLQELYHHNFNNEILRRILEFKYRMDTINTWVLFIFGCDIVPWYGIDRLGAHELSHHVIVLVHGFHIALSVHSPKYAVSVYFCEQELGIVA